MYRLNKYGFIFYYVVFFMIVIFMLAGFFFSRVSNTGKNITREMGITNAQNLCESGIDYAKKIIYENYMDGNYFFYREMEFPIELERENGDIYIEEISSYFEADEGEDPETLPVWEKGAQRGKKDYLKIKVRSRSRKFPTEIETESIFEIRRLDFLK